MAAKKKVYYVGNDDSIRQVLEVNDFEVEGFPSGETMLNHMGWKPQSELSQDLPDLFLIENLRGDPYPAELLLELARRANLPRIIMSGGLLPSAGIRDAVQNGAKMLAKPFPMRELITAVDDALNPSPSVPARS